MNSENLGEEEIAEEEDAFATAEDTDLNEDELDLNVSRKMSIRALNVVTMHRFSPGSITAGFGRISNDGLNSNRTDNQAAATAFPPKPANKPSLLLRASSLLQANHRKSTINRLSKLTANRMSSNLRNVR